MGKQQFPLILHRIGAHSISRLASILLVLLCGNLFISTASNGQRLSPNRVDLISMEDSLKDGQFPALLTLTAWMTLDTMITRASPTDTVTASAEAFAMQLFHRYTHFNGLDGIYNLDAPKIQRFVGDHSEHISFVPALSAFVDTNWRRTSAYRIEPLETDFVDIKAEHKHIQDALVAGNGQEAQHILTTLQSSTAIEHRDFLITLVSENAIPSASPFTEAIHAEIAFQLGAFRDLHAFSALKVLLEQHSFDDYTSLIIATARLTNIHPVYTYFAASSDPTNGLNPQALLAKTFSQVDALGSIERAVAWGYAFMYPGVEDLPNRAAFLENLLAHPSSHWWIQYHALQDLIQTEDPGVLFRIARTGFNGIHVDEDPQQRPIFRPVPLVESLTGFRVAVPNREGDWTLRYEDRIAQLNYLDFWFTNGSSCSWEKSQRRFTCPSIDLPE